MFEEVFSFSFGFSYGLGSAVLSADLERCDRLAKVRVFLNFSRRENLY